MEEFNLTVYVLEDAAATVQRMVDYYRTAQSSVTDFNEGSEIRNLLESIGLGMNQLLYLVDYMLRMGYVQTAEGTFLDMLGLIVNCTRIAAVKSTGTLTFSTPTAKGEDISIPVNTLCLCSTDSGLYFETTAAGTLTAGNTTVNIAGQAIIGGTDGNVIADKIDTINTVISDLTVTNNSAFTGGVDEECDTSYRSRIIEAGKGGITGSITWYKTIVGNVTGVHDAGVINNPGGNYDLEILVNGTTKPTPAGVLSDVEDLFTDEDYMIGGINVLVGSPSFIETDINGTLSVLDGYVFADVLAEVEDDIACYFNGGTTSYGVDYTGLDVGDDIVKSTLDTIIANNPGHLDHNISSPASNVTIATDEAAQLGTITITEV